MLVELVGFVEFFEFVGFSLKNVLTLVNERTSNIERPTSNFEFKI